MKKLFINILSTVVILLVLVGCKETESNPNSNTTELNSTAGEPDRNIYIPTTISLEAQAILKQLADRTPYKRVAPKMDDLVGWTTFHKTMENQMNVNYETIIKKYNVIVEEQLIGGIPVLDIKPVDWIDNGKVLIYTHGGAYTLFSSKSTIGSSAPMCNRSKLRVISIDYTVSPHANWKEIQEQVLSVFRELLSKGYDMKDIAIYGDSAGGGLAISTVINLRDAGLGMPSAVVLLSPWADISDAGDSQVTLKDADPTLSYEYLLKNSALAYSNGLDLQDPRVSPLYSDFKKGFPPSLITEGTKCIFLSTSVRLYQALEIAGQSVKLDMYEGMWHVFQQAPMPESEIAINKAADFINKHLE